MTPNKVIFRKYPDGDIIAILPEIHGTADPYTCTSYMHIGQHGSCDPGHVVNTTTPATDEEAKPLRKELAGIGYAPFVIYKRLQYHMHYARLRELNKGETI